MAYTAKKYSRINWKNRPSTATALGATNMNHMDVFLNDVDNALVEMEAAKLNIATANSMLKSVAYNKSTGVWNFQQLDGTSFSFDQNIEKIPVSFSLSESGVLTMTTEDGTQWECNVAELIKDYVYDDSETIGFSKEFKSNEYHVSAIVKEGSIESKHLNPDYRADIQSYMNTAQTAANDSLTYSKDSKRWAVGDASYSGSETDNSKYYKEKAEEAKTSAEKARDEAQAATGAQIMTQTKMGVGRPDGSTIGVTDGIFGLIAKAINLPAVDTSGIVGTAGEESTTQALLDELASRVVSKLVTNDALTTKLADYMTKSMMSGTQVNDANHVPTSALAYSMNKAIETLNSNFNAFGWRNDKSRRITLLPYVKYDEFGTSTDTILYFQNYLKWLVKTYPGLRCDIGIGVGAPNAQGIMLLNVYSMTNYNNTGYPQYCSGVFWLLSSKSTMYFGTTNGVWYNS